MSGFDEKDDFWSLESMLPPSALKKKTVKSSYDVDAVTLDISGSDVPKGEAIPPRPAPKYPPITARVSRATSFVAENKPEKAPQISYTPSCPLIKRVDVIDCTFSGAASERFLSDGYALIDKECAFEGNVPYLTAFPQYATATEEQRRCYIGFRTEVRNGRYPTVDKAYLYLYAYELINLTSYLSAKKRAELLANALYGCDWADDKTFSDLCTWLADMCLVHQIDVPKIMYEDSVHTRAMKLARVREIFVKHNSAPISEQAYRFALSACRYDYRTSRFYKDYKQYYDKYIDDAVCFAMQKIAETSFDLKLRDETCTLTRESYFGAYRTAGVRYKIVMECACITHTDAEKSLVTDLVKYAENCLRAALCIKQRLTVEHLSLQRRDMIKRYFAENVVNKVAPAVKPSLEKTAVIPEVPEYERMYEPKREVLSFENAARIEELSWNVTDKLVTAFDGMEIEDVQEEIPNIEAVETETAVTGAIEPLIEGLKLLQDNNFEEFCGLAKRLGKLVDAFADEINEMLLEEIGDVGLEGDGMRYWIAEWYCDEVAEIVGRYGRRGN